MTTRSQANVQRFLDEHGLRTSVETRLLDLTSELGEISKEYLSATEYGHLAFQSTSKWQEELGDVYFALLSLAVESDADIEACLESVLEKYAARLQREGSIGSGC